MIQKKYFFITLLLFVCVILIGTGGLNLIKKFEPQPLYFGVAGPFSGEDANYGKEMIRGIDLCLEKVNAQGGINGRKLQYILGDDMNTSNFAMKVASNFAKQNVLCVLGHYSCLASIPAGRIYMKEGVPAITASAPSDNITNNNEWYFRTIPSASSQAHLIASFVHNHLKEKLIILVFSQDAYGHSFHTSFTEIAPNFNLKINQRFAIDLDTPLMAQIFNICQRIKTLKHNGPIFLATSSKIAALLIEKLKLMRINATIMGANSLSNESFNRAIKNKPLEKAIPGYYSDGIIATSSDIFGNYLLNDQSITFYKNYFSKYNTHPTSIAAGYFDATTTMIDILNQIETDEKTTIDHFRRLIRNYLADINKPDYAVSGISGDIFFDKRGNVIKKTGIGQYEKGNLNPYHQQFVLDMKYNDDKKLELTYKEVSVVKIKANILDININEHEFTVDLLLHFMHKNSTIDLSNIVFENTKSIVTTGKPIDEYTTKGMIHQTYKIRATFDKYTTTHDCYPFDQKKLVISFHPHAKDEKTILFSSQGFVEYNKSKFNCPGWHQKGIYAYGFVLKEKNTPLFHIVVHLTRDVYPLLINILIPGFVILCLLLSIYMLSPIFYKTAFMILFSCLGLNTILYVNLREVTINVITPYDEWFILLYGMIFLSLLMVFFIKYLQKEGRMKTIVWIKIIIAIFHLGGLGYFFYGLRGVLL